MSAFALPIPPPPLTGMASQAYGTLRYQAVVSYQLSGFRQMLAQALQHARDLRQLVLPGLRPGRIGQIEIGGVAAPKPCLVRRTDRHDDIAPELSIRSRLPTTPFNQKGTNRLRGSPQLIGNTSVLLRLRPALTDPMQLKR